MPRSFLTQRESRSTNMRHVLCHISSCFRAASLGKSGRRKFTYDVLRRNSEIFGCRKTRKVHFTIRVDILTFCLNVSRVLCTCMRVPCLRLCVCQPACVSRYRMPATACSACAGPLCSNALHLFARDFAVPVRVLSLHLVDILNCSHDQIYIYVYIYVRVCDCLLQNNMRMYT